MEVIAVIISIIVGLIFARILILKIIELIINILRIPWIVFQAIRNFIGSVFEFIVDISYQIYEFVIIAFETINHLVLNFSGFISQVFKIPFLSTSKNIRKIIYGTIAIWIFSFFDTTGRIRQSICYITVALFMLFGSYWQYYLWVNHDLIKLKSRPIDFPDRTLFSAFISFLLMLGILIIGILKIYFDNSTYNLDLFHKDLSIALTFSILFIVKSFFSPILTMLGLTH